MKMCIMVNHTEVKSDIEDGQNFATCWLHIIGLVMQHYLTIGLCPYQRLMQRPVCLSLRQAIQPKDRWIFMKTGSMTG